MKSKYILIFIGIIIVLGIAALLIPTHTTPQTPAVTIADPSTLPGIQTSQGPWPVELGNLAARLRAIGLPALSAEGTVLHTHQHLDIFIHGKSVDVPAGIGINEGAGFISPIHVHDTTGVIHVESPTVQTFTLGQFFDIWGVKFLKGTIGGYVVDEKNNVFDVYVNGKKYRDDPRLLTLEPHQEIVIVYGTDKETPKTIPSSYTFPAGE